MPTVNITPDTSLIGKLGARSRAFPNVVTELVDNSLDSWWELESKSRKKVSPLSVIIAPNRHKFRVQDNAGGMTRDELEKALTVAYSEKNPRGKSIGMYGMGMKSAIMYIGDKFEIFTMSSKEKGKVHYVSFDRARFEKSRTKWEIELKTISESAANKKNVIFEEGHGTLIQVENSRYKPGLKKGIVRRLAKVFAPILPQNPLDRGNTKSKLEMKNIFLSFGGEQVFADGPFYRSYEAPSAKFIREHPAWPTGKGIQKEAAIIPGTEYLLPKKKIGDRSVFGKLGLLDRSMAHNKQYGFDLVLNGRIIETNAVDDELETRIGFKEDNSHARVVGQLFLDGWITDHQKLAFIKDDEELWDRLAEYVKIHLGKSGVLRKSSQRQHNQHKRVTGQLLERTLSPKVRKKLETSTQRAVRHSSFKAALRGNKGRRIKDGSRIAIVDGKASTPLKLSDTKILQSRPRTEFEHAGQKNGLIRTEVKRESSAIYVVVNFNLDHPFVKNFSDSELETAAFILMLDAFAEYTITARGSSELGDFIGVREKLFRTLKR